MGAWTRWTVLVAGLLIVGGLTLGFFPVFGQEDGEGFHCGSALIYDNSLGYAGSEGFSECRDAAGERRRVVFASMGIGLALLGASAVESRRRQFVRTSA